ncbi:OsmC family protein [Geobacter pelophilus]|uniref:OsmC family protein n=1 Tax=Geoanaerobacter pelophilus TaxID=60036 RepID=A0AAW4KXW3_9BACT|nr:OsmC family protein [Geoanaerobacter pelophilus]MBT0663468.1 OsmC family protein [Geoanaerobacter pelophilus]
MEMLIRLGTGMKVTAEFDNFSIVTDQPPSSGGDGSAPTPFQLFLASLGTCAGVYIASFCQQRGISSERITIHQKMEHTEGEDGKKRLARVSLEIRVPEDFPQKYHNALIKTAELCAVKKAVMDPPEFSISTVVA